MSTVNAKYAWCQVAKAETPKRSAATRVSDFLEVYSLLDEETARQQAMRCIQCPEPACVEGCPVNNFIPAWMSLVAEGRFLEASRVLQTSTCMEDVCSRLCAHPCETRCILDGRGEPVAINAIERFLSDYGLAHGTAEPTPPAPNGRKVAVMNAGPCGLTCAFDLARLGYAVTVFDSRSQAGGALLEGIPSFRMEPEVLQRRLSSLGKLGAQFRLGVKPGVEPTLRELRATYDAVFFGAALGRLKPLGLPGAQLPGVIPGLTFLVQQHAPHASETGPLSLAGKRVVVLGGGNMAIDCLRAALRGGAAQVLGVYRRSEGELTANPEDYQSAREEGARFEFLTAPVAILGTQAGAVRGVRCVRTRLVEPEPDGRPAPVPMPGSEFELAADVVIFAFGFEPAPFAAEGDLNQIPLDASGHIAVDDQLMTGLPGVFAGGTLVRGLSALLESVHDARQAARAIDAYLSGKRAAAENQRATDAVRS
jgi:glutamate synthase (NADPH) small chain